MSANARPPRAWPAPAAYVRGEAWRDRAVHRYADVGRRGARDRTYDASVEHVLLVAAMGEWQTKSTVEEVEASTNLLGNLCLIDKEANWAIGWGFADKCCIKTPLKLGISNSLTNLKSSVDVVIY